MNDDSYILEMVRDKYHPDHVYRKYRLRKSLFGDIIYETNNRSKIKMYLDLYGFKVAHYHFNPVMTKYMVIDLENR